MTGITSESFQATAARAGIRSTLIGVAINAILAAVKGTAGVLGHSYALVADAIESASDILTSLIVLCGVKMAGKPADTNHPYGHGKFEPLAAVVVGLTLFGAAILISVESVKEIAAPHHAPEPFTLAVLLVVVVVKEVLFRYVIHVGTEVKSTAVKADAWHHRSDAFTSGAAFVGISIALLGGPGYESADDFAALIAAAIIAANAVFILRPAISELLDAAPDPEIAERIRDVACSVKGVQGTHKCNVRKSALITSLISMSSAIQRQRFVPVTRSHTMLERRFMQHCPLYPRCLYMLSQRTITVDVHERCDGSP